MTKVVDRAIWGIGPVFIGLAVLLLNMCVLAYYFVVFPYFHTWSDTSIWIKLYNLFTLGFTLYVVYAIHFHYYMAITTYPGDMKQYSRDVNQVYTYTCNVNSNNNKNIGKFFKIDVIRNGRTLFIPKYMQKM